MSKSLVKEMTFKKQFELIKLGDVPATYASTDKLQLE